MVHLLVVGLALSSCDNNIALKPAEEGGDALDATELKGTGDFVYTAYAPLQDKPVEVFYHIPSSATSTTPVLMVYHGSSRDGAASRDQLIAESDAFGFIVIVPQFSTEHFPGGDAFNLGNMYVDGDNPTEATRVAEEEWTFSLVEPLFHYFTERTKSEVKQYDIFGFSGGGQFAHRHFIYKPNDSYNRVVAASSGWYTVLDSKIVFPYGTGSSPEEATDYSALLLKPLTILIGDADNDPDSPGLRNNYLADAQGLHRLDRANHFYSRSQQLATELGVASAWRIQVLPDVDHDYQSTSSAAAVLLYR